VKYAVAIETVAMLCGNIKTNQAIEAAATDAIATEFERELTAEDATTV
jgi:hypothetical protein